MISTEEQFITLAGEPGSYLLVCFLPDRVRRASLVNTRHTAVTALPVESGAEEAPVKCSIVDILYVLQEFVAGGNTAHFFGVYLLTPSSPCYQHRSCGHDDQSDYSAYDVVFCAVAAAGIRSAVMHLSERKVVVAAELSTRVGRQVADLRRIDCDRRWYEQRYVRKLLVKDLLQLVAQVADLRQ